MLTKSFFSPVSGPCIFTLCIPSQFSQAKGCGDHYTYRLVRKEAVGSYPEAYFISLLTGPDNESDYTYLGMLDHASGAVRITKASKYARDSWPVCLLERALSRVWIGDTAAIRAAGFDLRHEGRCGRCGRTLTTPESLERGIGPDCFAAICGAA